MRRGRPRLDRVQRRDVAGNYLWYEPYGFGPTAEDVAFLRHELGGDSPVDAGLQGGETLRLGPTGGSRCSRCPATRRATWGCGIRQRRGDHHRRGARGRRLRPRREPPDPAPLLHAGAYEATIRRLRALDPELLLTAHYEVMERAAARAFLDRSLGFVRAVRAGVRAAGTVELRPLTEAVDAAVGPFPAFTHELAASVRAHLAEI